MASADHIEGLTNHCRICAKKFSIKSEKIDKLRDENMTKLIKLSYNIDIHKDEEHIHPKYICLSCYSRMQHINAATHKRHIQPSVFAFNWKAHSSDGNCEVCSHFMSTKRGGRPKKERKCRGRPEGETTAQTLVKIKELTVEGLPECSIPPSSVITPPVDISLLVCPLCLSVACAPIQLNCDNLVCTNCLTELLIDFGKNTRCPCCKIPLDSDHIAPCPKIACSVVKNLKVRCARGCRVPITLQDFSQHEHSCNPSTLPPPQSLLQLPLTEVLSTPLSEPLSPDEEQLCTRLVKRSTEGGEQLVLKTGGQVCCKILE